MAIGLDYIPQSTSKLIQNTTSISPDLLFTVPSGYTAIVCYLTLVPKHSILVTNTNVSMQDKTGNQVNKTYFEDLKVSTDQIVYPIKEGGFIVLEEGHNLVSYADQSSQVYVNVSYKLYQNISTARS